MCDTSSSAPDAAADLSAIAGAACGDMRADIFAVSLSTTRKQGDIVSSASQCSLPSINKREDSFRAYEKQVPESKLIHYSSGRGDCACGSVFVSNKKSSQASRDFSSLENPDSPAVPSYIPSVFLKHFKDSELQAFRKEAMSDYIIMKNKLALRELFINERTAREEIEDAAYSQLQAIHTRFCGESLEFSTLAEAPGRLLLKLQSRLLQRENLKNAESAEWEAQLLVEGRCAWQAEVKEQEEKTRAEMERFKQRKVEEDQFRAAIVFTVCRERTERELFEGEAEAAWSELCRKEAEGRKEAEQLAYERFMNSPEQLALTAERERKALRERKKRARLQRIRQNEQKRIIERCHHGRNGTSLLENPGLQKSCCRCRIRFDEHLGYYVNNDANSSSKNQLKGKRVPSTTITAALPSISKLK